MITPHNITPHKSKPFLRRPQRATFAHLNVHSAYSLLAGASRVEALVARASAQGYRSLALTDTDAGYGLPLFQACCDAVELHAIHGAELHDPAQPTERAVVLAQDASGYRTLCRLITRRKLDERFSLIDDLPREAEGLLVLTPSTATAAHSICCRPKPTCLGPPRPPTPSASCASSRCAASPTTS